jgi:hypothetical protein
MFFQSYPVSESSAIASIEVNGQDVSIIFQSNLDKEYNFVTENEDQIVEFLTNRTDESIGQMYHRWVSENVLIPVEALAAV